MTSDSSSAYLEKHKILVYLQDAITQLIAVKDDNPKVNVKKFLCDYFACVRDGNHTLFRDYDFISATPHNRCSFVRTFWKCFRYISRRGDVLSLAEYHSLLALICPDFPLDLVLKAGRIVLLDDAIDCLLSFSDFLYAFQVQFLYDEFLTRCGQLHDSLLSGSSRSALVVVPACQDDTSTNRLATAAPSSPVGGDDVTGSGDCSVDRPRTEAVNAQAFLRLVQSVCERGELFSPSFPILDQIFKHCDTITWYDFLRGLSKSDELTKEIGFLPSRLDAMNHQEEENSLAFASITEALTASSSSSSKKKRNRSDSSRSTQSKGTRAKRAIGRPNSASVAPQNVPGKAAIGAMSSSVSLDSSGAVPKASTEFSRPASGSRVSMKQKRAGLGKQTSSQCDEEEEEESYGSSEAEDDTSTSSNGR